ncbi:hypothetical protein LCGC14_0956040 [marine sediment metagenome]|uniref:ParB-like N-terminal domain-containing protein n=1 Tax=marine sediment metagenome TaxID=412755 RepID=A0A0F9QZ64_9ZZZZ
MPTKKVVKPRKKSKKKSKKTGQYAQVKLQTFKLKDLEEAPYNARSMTHDALSGLSQSIAQLGLLSFPVVNLRTGGPRIVGGHQRIVDLKAKGEEEVRCIVVEFDDTAEKSANLILNNRAIQGTFIPELTKQLLIQIAEVLGPKAEKRLKSLRLDKLLKEVLRNLRPVAGVDDIETGGKTDEDDIPTITKTTADSIAGRFYTLGSHVLVCSGLEKPGSLEGFPVKCADMAFTRIAEKDQINENFLNVYVRHLLDNTDGAVYVATNMLTLPTLQRRFQALGGHWSNTLVWISPTTKASAKTPYKEATVPVLYGWREGSPRYFRARNAIKGERSSSNLFRLRRGPKTKLPVEVVVEAILDASKVGDTILDTDVGRGATLIAAEKMGRRLVGYARTTRACDLVRKRWALFVHGEGVKWQSVTPMMT